MWSTARAIRRAADEIEAQDGRDRFRRRRSLDRSPAVERLVHSAVARARAGDPDALRFLYLRYADNVYGYVCSIVRDEHEAEDVTQQIFAKLLTTLDRYEPRQVPFSAWILRVAHNAAIDHLRARRPVPVEDLRPLHAADDTTGRERFADLRLALAALPEEQRDVHRAALPHRPDAARGRRADRPLGGRRPRPPAPRPPAAAARDARARRLAALAAAVEQLERPAR